MPRGAIGGVRQSSQKAGDAVRQLLSPQHLQSVLKSLARSVQIAHAVAPDKWGLRLNFKSIMLKVGFVEVFEVDVAGFDLLAERHLIPTKFKSDQQIGISRAPYKNAAGCDRCYAPLSAFSRTYKSLHSAHEAAIRIAARAPRRADITKDHSPGLIRFLSRELGERVPQPAHHTSDARLPEEIRPGDRFFEGGKTTIQVNRYERDPAARASCLNYWGMICVACGKSMEAIYGPQVLGLIHVHHLKPVARFGKRTAVDSIRDLRPVCPNCHAVIHSIDPPRTVNAVKSMLRERKRSWLTNRQQRKL
jgi:hypothetical protein